MSYHRGRSSPSDRRLLRPGIKVEVCAAPNYLAPPLYMPHLHRSSSARMSRFVYSYGILQLCNSAGIVHIHNLRGRSGKVGSAGSQHIAISMRDLESGWLGHTRWNISSQNFFNLGSRSCDWLYIPCVHYRALVC